MDINRCVSLSEFAYNAWSADCNAVSNIFIPHTGKEEDDARAAYYGGRVTPQRKLYESTDYVQGQTEYNFEEIRDYLVYPDVNSLYPAVCHKFLYAIGLWRYLTPSQVESCRIRDVLNGVTDSALLELGIELEQLIRPERGLIHRMCCKVDVSCPKDLLTCFLVERTENGLAHTLNDKVDQWYWGSEIEEAVTLGYVVTAVHEVKLYDFSASIFQDFVDICWQGRLDNPKSKTDFASNAKNAAFKLTLNALTGKFGQKSHPTNTYIHNTQATHSKKVWCNGLSRIGFRDRPNVLWWGFDSLFKPISSFFNFFSSKRNFKKHLKEWKISTCSFPPLVITLL